MTSEKPLDEVDKPGATDDERPIFKLANECDQLFQKAVSHVEDITAENENFPRDHAKATESVISRAAASIRRLLVDDRDRFGYWASYLGVFARYANLDRRLRRNKHYQDLVLLSLDMLRDNLYHSASRSNTDWPYTDNFGQCSHQKRMT
jgi:hypothetical protein